ncbi:MAG: lactonase family protein, partial [Bryobacteraceae bacterium]
AKSKGIYVCRFDPANGKLGQPELAGETRNPSFLAVHPNGRWLYAAGEVSDFEGQRAGAVSAFRIEEGTGRLTLLNAKPSGGSGPCYLALDRSGKCLLVANYNSGSLAAFPIQADGRLGPQGASVQHHGSSLNHERQEGPHAHFITTDPANRFALACDLGLDKVFVYHLDPQEASLRPNQPPYASIQPGSGPRHLAFHPNGRYVYVINEMASSLAGFEYDAEQGTLKPIQTISTLPADFHGQNTCAEVQIHPSGKFLYASNRGQNTIASFAIDSQTGKLAFLGSEPSGGKTPRHFVFDPSGAWLLAENQDSDNVVVFRVDASTGKLTPTGEQVEVGAPVCAVFYSQR